MKFKETDIDITRDPFQALKAGIIDKPKDLIESVINAKKIERVLDSTIIERPTEQLRGATFTNKGPQLDASRSMFAQRIKNNARAAASVGNKPTPNTNRPKQNEADQER